MDVRSGPIAAIYHFSVVLMLTIGFSIGQTVTVTGPSAVEQGSDTEYTCTLTGGDPSSSTFVWRDESLDPTAHIFFNENPIDNNPKHDNFAASVNGATSTMTITNTVIEDEGIYRCTVGSLADEKSLDVEVRYTLSLDVTSPLVNGTTYDATCDALNGRPNLTITWMLGDSGSPCIDTVELPRTADEQGLFSKRSVCTFQADSANNGDTLRCIISGHQVSELNGEETTTLNIHSAPGTGIMIVVFQFQDPDLRVSCDIDATDQPNPIITNYYITSNGTLIHQSSTGVNFVDVAEPNSATDFFCVAGNYLGNTSSPVDTYGPPRRSTLPPKTEPITIEGTTSEPRIIITRSEETILPEGTTSEPSSEEPSLTSCTCECPSSGASAGIAVLAILLAGSIIINGIQFIVFRRYSKRADKNGSQKVTPSDVRVGSNEANDNMAYEMIQSGDRAYTPLKITSSGTSRSATINPENLTFFTRLGSIGRGDFGAVWKGELRSNQGKAAVAIRQIPDNVSKSTNSLQSVKVLCELSDQVNVVKCLGFCQQQSSIIYVFISGGTLLTHLQMTGVQSQPTYSNLKPNRVHIDEGSLLNFAWQIAKGMQFLASKKIIHGTLCAHNVLLGDKQCKLSDYGLASSLFSNRGKATRWSSPETMATGVQSTEGDIWSFGIVLWEIVTLGARPYPNMTFDTVQKEVSNGYKMPRPHHCGLELYTIMSRCWETEGRNRIRFDEMLKTLERILEKTHDYLSLSDLDKDLYASPLDV